MSEEMDNIARKATEKVFAFIDNCKTCTEFKVKDSKICKPCCYTHAGRDWHEVICQLKKSKTDGGFNC